MYRSVVLLFATLFFVLEAVSSSNATTTTTITPTPSFTLVPTTSTESSSSIAIAQSSTSAIAPSSTSAIAPSSTSAIAPALSAATATSVTSVTVPTTTVTTSPPEHKFIKIEITFGIPFKEDYKDTSSEAYKELKTNFTRVLNGTFEKMPGFLRVEILDIRSGSVVCDFKVFFDASTNATTVNTTLYNKINNGMLGGYNVTKIEVKVPTPTATTTVKPTASATASATTPTATATTAPTATATTAAPTTSSDKLWDKVIMDYLGGTLISFIVMVAAVGLCLILLIALICTCCRYRKLKKKTHFPKDLIIDNDSSWINSNDNLLMWERNLRATEVNPGNATNRPSNEKRP